MVKNAAELLKELEQAKNTIEFEEFLKRNDAKMQKESFGDCVLRLCAKYEMTPSALQTKIAISKSQFYSLLNGTRNPSKGSVVKIAFGLQVTVDEITELLYAAGYHALDVKEKEDAILLFGIKNRKAVGKVNELLKEYNSKIELLDKE